MKICVKMNGKTTGRLVDTVVASVWLYETVGWTWVLIWATEIITFNMYANKLLTRLSYIYILHMPENAERREKIKCKDI